MIKKTKNNKSALDFAQSLRGQLIISQALCYAIDLIDAMPKHKREHSNQMDMKYIRDMLFPMYKAVQDATDLHTSQTHSEGVKNIKTIDRLKTEIRNLGAFIDEKIAEKKYANLLLEIVIKDAKRGKPNPLQIITKGSIAKINRHLKKEGINNAK